MNLVGLDPAGPQFQNEIGNLKIDSADAQYVQCIYTDADWLGTKSEHGDCHGNFFMNDGEDQAGCKTFLCDHSRAIEYFMESLSQNHTFWGSECHIDQTVPYKNRAKDKIGIYSNQERGTFCVSTNSESPYAKPEAEFSTDLANKIKIQEDFERLLREIKSLPTFRGEHV